MRKIYYIAILLGFFATTLTGQIRFGAGATYLANDNNNLFGLHGRAVIPEIIDKGSLVPNFTYYLEDGATAIAVDVNLLYDLIYITDETPLYGIGGLNWTRTAVGEISNSDIGINLGLGTVIASQVYVEPRLLLGLCKNCGLSFGANVGYYFN